MFRDVPALIVVLLTVSCAFGADRPNGDRPNGDRPNIVLFLCDDLGYGDLQCYGHPHIQTPNIDRLATTGIRFTDFYSAAPVCSPSRVGLLTGRSPNLAGVYDWIPPARASRPDAREQVHMRASEITIAQLLRTAGYQTCMSGKWHCTGQLGASEAGVEQQPTPGDHGFDHWMATQNNASPSHRNPVNFLRNGTPVGPVEAFSCQYVVDEVIRWLDTEADAEKPFFAFLPFHEPHEPVASPENLVKQYAAVTQSDDEAQFFANVHNVDLAVGKMLAAIDRMDRRDNTLVIFTSDNGPETLNRYRSATRSYGQPGPLRGMKLHTTDAGFRVAGIMNWQGRINGGLVSEVPVSSLDFLPTFCELAGIEPPASLELDGTSFLPVLESQPIQRRKPLLWAYFNAINEHRVAMRDGQWKLLAKLNRGEFPKMQNVTTKSRPAVAAAMLTDFELYDLSDDIGESKNVAAEYPEVLDTLSQSMTAAYVELSSKSHVWEPAD